MSDGEGPFAPVLGLRHFLQALAHSTSCPLDHHQRASSENNGNLKGGDYYRFPTLLQTNVRYPVAACSSFAEHPYDGDLGNLNHTTDYALRIVERNLMRHRVFGDLESLAGAGPDLGECKIYGPRHTPGDTAQPAHRQDQ